VSALARRDAPSIAAAPAEECYALAGHSGARVVLHAAQAASFVRKTAASPAQNPRLLEQIEKQRDLVRSGVPFPRVLQSGFDAQGRAYFDMAYIPGRTLADAVVNALPFALDPVLAAVERMLWLFKACRGEALAPEMFRDKIAAIGAAKGVDSEAARICAERLLRCDWQGIPSSPSHGDLTLENIMLGPEREIVFIDCDAPWVSSWWLDVGKLHQDILGQWCLRRLGAGVQRVNATQKLSQIGAAFRPLIAREEPRLAAYLPQLAALSLFRALPYAADPGTASFIVARMQRVLED
jgi:hypothetical protein